MITGGAGFIGLEVVRNAIDRGHVVLNLDKGTIGRTYNIGGENEKSNLELVNMICTILDGERPLGTGCYADLITFVSDRPGHDMRYAIDNSRICDELGCTPQVNLEDGLRKTVEWYIDNGV